MYDGPVLDIGVRADSNRVEVGAEYGTEPDGGSLADVHVADEHGAAAQQRIGRDSRHLVEVSLEEDPVVVFSECL